MIQLGGTGRGFIRHRGGGILIEIQSAILRSITLWKMEIEINGAILVLGDASHLLIEELGLGIGAIILYHLGQGGIGEGIMTGLREWHASLIFGQHIVAAIGI